MTHCSDPLRASRCCVVVVSSGEEEEGRGGEVPEGGRRSRNTVSDSLREAEAVKGIV